MTFQPQKGNLNMLSFVIATEEGPFAAETSCSQNKCTTVYA